MQDAGHVVAEAFGDALASCRGPAPECRNWGAGHPDASRSDTKCAVRSGMGEVVRDRPSGSDDSRPHGAVSLQTGRLMDRFQTCHPLAVQDGEEARAAHDGAAG